MGIATPCDNIFRIKLPAGNQNIAVHAQLSATTIFWYILTDKFGNQYTKQITTDGTGDFQILTADLPVGLFSAYAGSFLLQVKKTLQDAAPQPLKFCTSTYDTIQLDFANYPESAVPPSVVDCK